LEVRKENQVNCPSCGKQLVEDHIKLAVKPNRVKKLLEDVRVRVTTVSGCSCGVEVSEVETIEYSISCDGRLDNLVDLECSKRMGVGEDVFG
jgi:hypothetical protein